MGVVNEESNEEDKLFDWINYAAYLCAVFLFFIIPIVYVPARDLNKLASGAFTFTVANFFELNEETIKGYPIGLRSGVATLGYFWVTKLSLWFSTLKKSSDTALLLCIVSWAWFYYWTLGQANFLVAFVGHIVYLGTIGRILFYISWLNELRNR